MFVLLIKDSFSIFHALPAVEHPDGACLPASTLFSGNSDPRRKSPCKYYSSAHVFNLFRSLVSKSYRLRETNAKWRTIGMGDFTTGRNLIEGWDTN